MKVEKNVDNDQFPASQMIGDKLLKGWTLLNSSCHICHITPLIKERNKEERFCVRCNIYIKVVDNEEEEDTNSSKEINQKKNDKEVINDTIKYIKEIKLQNEEFNEILNKNYISKDEIENLFEYKNYIKERCGYNVGDWLNFDNGYNNIQMDNDKAKLENGISHTVKENKCYEKYENKTFIENHKHNLKTQEENCISINGQDSNKYDSLKMKISILNKTKNVFFDKLEKYSEYLSRSNNKCDEIEIISIIENLITILEKLNNLKKHMIV